MPTSVYYSGKQVFTPGVYSNVNASALNSTNVQASGIVALIGSSQGGGIPYNAVLNRTQFPVFTTPQQVAAAYPSGDLLEAANLAFNPSNDPAILGGAQQVVILKVDPATQASAVFGNAVGAVFTATTKAWGPQANGVNLSITAGSSQGKLITISNGVVTESRDNLGSGPFASINYSGSGTMTGLFDNSGNFTANATQTQTGLQNDISGNAALLVNTSVITAQCNAADNGKTLTVVGVNNAGQPFSDTIVLQAGVAVPTPHAFNSICGLALSSASGDVIQIKAVATSGLQFTLPAGTTTKGVIPGFAMGGGKITFTVSATTSPYYFVVEGVTTSGQAVIEAVYESTTGTQTANAYSRVTRISVASLTNSINLTIAYQALAFAASPTSAVSDLAAFLAGTGTGISLSYTDSTQAGTTLLSLDKSGTAASLAGGGLSLSAGAAAIVNWINNNSSLVTATQATGASGLPNNTTTATYLMGGTQSVATFADWQNCLNLLQQIRVNTVVPLTCSPAVAIATDAHCSYMCGPGQSERDCVVGLANSSLTAPASVSSIASQTLALNSRHTRAVAQSFSKYNVQGQLQTYQPQFLAAIVAGMQAGAGVGTSLTNKICNVLSIAQDSSWNPLINSDQLIQNGLCFFVQKDNIGIQCVRNITTWQKDNNVAYSEASVNQAADYAVYNFRYALVQYVGQDNFSGTLNAIYAGAVSILQQLQTINVITAFQKPTLTSTGDQVLVAITIAPVQPTNFIIANVSLVQNITTI